MRNLKPIYIAQSMRELNSNIPDKVSSSVVNAKILCESSKKLWIEGKKSYDAGDDERSYILFMRYMELTQKIVKCDDYQRDRKFYDAMLSVSDKHKVLALCEELSVSLKLRYQNIVGQKPSHQKLSEETKKGETKVHHLPADVLESDELFNLLFGEYGSIASKNRTQSSQMNSTLVLDIRSEDEFISSQISCANMINIDSNRICDNITFKQVERLLDRSVRYRWNKWRSMRNVVIVDRSSNSWNENPCVEIIRNSLLSTLPSSSVVKANELPKMSMLKSGYINFALTYPMHVTNPQVVMRWFDNEPQNIPSNQNNEPFNDVTNSYVPRIKNNFSSDMEASLDSVVNRDDVKYPSLVKTKKTHVKLPVDSTRNRDPTEVVKPTPPDSADDSAKGLNRSNSTPHLVAASVRDDVQRPVVNREVKPVDQPSSSINPSPSRILKPKSSTLNNNNFDQENNEFSPVFHSFGSKLGHAGLKNLGNSCYMNAVLQCLSNFKFLARFFLNIAVRGIPSQCGVYSETKGMIATAFSKVIQAMVSDVYRSISPVKFKSTLAVFSPHQFGTSDQQDAHEFLLVILDWLHNDINEAELDNRKSSSNQENSDENIKHEIQLYRESRDRDASRDKSIIRELFYGQRKSTLTCLTCLYESKKFEPFFEMSLQFPNSSSLVNSSSSSQNSRLGSFGGPFESPQKFSLAKCLDLWFQPEYVEWKCPKCKLERRSSKKLDIVRLPPILTIHLSRFYQDASSFTNYFSSSSGGWSKRQNFVDFPIQDLDLGSRILDTFKNENRHSQFSLYGVIDHHGGGLESGHYTATCKSAVDNTWLKYDDQNVSSLSSPNSVKSQNAYILFYSAVENLNM